MSAQLNLLDSPTKTTPIPYRAVIEVDRPDKSLHTTIEKIFPSQQEETKLQKARRILGEIVADIPDDVLEVHLVKFQYLVDCWLDSFEKETFGGKTLNQLLREG